MRLALPLSNTFDGMRWRRTWMWPSVDSWILWGTMPWHAHARGRSRAGAKIVEHAWVRMAREAIGPEGQVVPQQRRHRQWRRMTAADLTWSSTALLLGEGTVLRRDIGLWSLPCCEMASLKGAQRMKIA
eukprot:s4647_g6.t1